MTNFNGTSGNDVANATTNVLTGFSGGSVAALNDADADFFGGGAGNDTIIGGESDNIFSGGSGRDTMRGASFADIFGFNSGDVVASEIIDGKGGLDSIRTEATPGVLNLDFRTATVLSIEKITTAGFASDIAASPRNLTFGANQVGGTGLSLTTELSSFGHNMLVEFRMGAVTTLNLSGFTFVNWNSDDTLRIIGDASSETFTGTSRNDEIFGSFGTDTLNGFVGDDRLDGGPGADTMTGGEGNDLFFIENASDVVMEANTIGSGLSDRIEAGVFTIDLADYANVENVTLVGTLTLSAIGSAAANTFVGNDAANNLFGLGGADVLAGGLGNDAIQGGAARDQLFGGQGNDVFDYNATSESATGAATRDIIYDFKHVVDKIDLSTIDGNGAAAGNAFNFISTAAFSGVAGQLRFAFVDLAGTANDRTLVQGDTNGDGVADIEIEINGLVGLSGLDFVV